MKIKFGPYKGMHVAEVPSYYLRYLDSSVALWSKLADEVSAELRSRASFNGQRDRKHNDRRKRDLPAW
jgi:hypothetical protein